MILEQLEQRELLALTVMNPEVNISQRTGDQSQGAIAADPNDLSRLFVVSNTENPVPGLFAAYSSDGGVNWTGRIMGNGADGIASACCDASAAWDEFGNLFVAYINANQDTIRLVLSTDGGLTFANLANFAVTTGGGFFQPILAQPTVTIGPDGAGNGSVWLSWSDDAIDSIRVTGARVTGLGAAAINAFSGVRNVPGTSGNALADIAVGPNGEVMVAYQSVGFFGFGATSIISANVDPDGLGPAAFRQPGFVSDCNVGSGTFITAQQNVGIDAEVGLAWDRSGGPHNGRIYLVYTDSTAGGFFGNDDTDVFVRFTDQEGCGWSDPIRVNDDAGMNSQFLPRIALDQVTGNVAVSWYDARNDDGNGPSVNDTDGIANDDAQFFVTVSSDGGMTFEPNVQVSDLDLNGMTTGTSNVTGNFLGTDFGGYTGLAYTQSVLHPLWAGNNPLTPNIKGLPALDLLTSTVVFTDTNPPHVVSTNPVNGSIITGAFNSIEFTFNELMDAASFNVALDVVSFTGPSGSIPVNSFQWLPGPVANFILQINFTPVGPGDYSITIGPNINDLAGNAMDQDLDGTTAEVPQDEFSASWTIPPFVVTSMVPRQNLVEATFSRPIDATTFTPANIIVERSGSEDTNANSVLDCGLDTICGTGDPGDEDTNNNGVLDLADVRFAPDLLNTRADVTIPLTQADIIVTSGTTITINLPGAIPTDLYRVHFVSDDPGTIGTVEGIKDTAGDALDGEFSGAPPSGNNNMFPSGDGTFGGDFFFPFYSGPAPLGAATAGVLPPLLVATDPVDISGGGIQNESSPSIAIDPSNPQHLAMAYVRHFVPADGNFFDPLEWEVELSVSSNGGTSWTDVPLPGHQCDPSVAADPNLGCHRFARSDDPSVAFDPLGNFFVVYREHNAADGGGFIVLQKFSFSNGTAIQTVFNQNIYGWVQDPAFSPAIAVDTSVASFTDPGTGSTRTDPHAGNVYVTWSSNNVQPPNPGPANNPNVVYIAVSSDGGNTFSTRRPLNDGVNIGTDRNAAPRIAISQGNSDGTVPAGQVNVVWDDFGTATGATPPFDFIMADRISDGGTGLVLSDNNGGFIGDAFDPGNSQPHFPSSTSFPITVNITDPRFSLLTDLDVMLNLDHNALTEVSIVLVPPVCTGVGAIVLALNGVDAGGNAFVPARGLSGTALGTTPLGFPRLGTIFDDDAARSIFQGAAPYTGYFRPEAGQLSDLNGLTPSELNGTWLLRITDFRASTNPSPFPFLSDWSMIMTSGLTTGFDSTVAITSSEHGALQGPFPRTVAASPNWGVSPGVSITSDNTLGDFSPFQGRLYVAYVDRIDDPTNPAANTDIFLSTSDDGGVTWFATGPGFFGAINDDEGVDALLTAGAAFKYDGTSGLRTQLNPAITVDPVTGTVFAAWLDARDDAANARVATYVTASNDGGQTWSKNTFANPLVTAIDNYDGSTRIYGPLPDNQSNSNATHDATFNFGSQIGLVAYDGVAHPVWPSNQNRTESLNGPVPPTGPLSNIVIGQVRYTDGPRIVDSSMGPVDSAMSFDVTFDRPVDALSFMPTPGVPGQTIFQATFESGNDGFTFNNDGLDGIALTADDGLWHRTSRRGADIGHSSSNSMYYGLESTGTYNTGAANSGVLTSPMIALPAGVPLTLSFNYFLATEAFGGFDNAVVNVVVSTATTVASNAINLIDPSGTFRPVSLDLSSFAGQTVQIAFSFDTVDAIANNFEGWFVDDVAVIQQTIPPEISVTYRDVLGNDTDIPITGVQPISCNVIGCTQFRVSFDPAAAGIDPLAAGTYRYDVGPNISDRVRTSNITVVPGPVVSQSAINPQVPKRVPPSGTGGSGVASQDITTSTIDFTSAAPSDLIADIDVNLTLTHTFDFDLVITLIAPDGTRVLLSANNGGAGDNYTNTTFDDSAAVSIAAGFPFAFAPFNGSFRPEQSLDGALIGKAVNGIWTLEIEDQFFTDFGSLASWSMTITTGTLQSSGINGNIMDQNANGIASEPVPTSDVYSTPAAFNDTDTLPLQVTGPRVVDTRVGVEYPANDAALPRPICDSLVLAAPCGNGVTGTFVTSSTLVVLDHVPITDLDVYIDISGATLADLQIELIHEDNLTTFGVDPISVPLVAAGDLSGSDLSRTIFSDADEPAASLATATAPYRAVFSARELLHRFDDSPELRGAQNDLSGVWTLRITDLAANTSGGTLNGWGLIVNPTGAYSNLFQALVQDGSVTTSTINVGQSFLVSDVNVHLNITHPLAQDLTIRLLHGNAAVTLVSAVTGGGSDFLDTTFDDEATTNISDPLNLSPYSGFFMPQQALSGLDGLDAAGAWQLEITDGNGNFVEGVLQAWTLDFGAVPHSDDNLVLQGTSNFMDVTFDRDVDPLTFTTPDIQRLIGPAGQIGASPLGPFRYATLDTSPLAFPIVDDATTDSTINVPDSFIVGDVDVLVDITHPAVEQLRLRLVAPDGTTVDLIDNLAASANFTNTILDDEAVQTPCPPGPGLACQPRPIQSGTAPYAGHFRPVQPLTPFDGKNSNGVWTLRIIDEVAGPTGTPSPVLQLNRWNLILTKRPNLYSAAPALTIPDNAATVSSTINVPDSFPIDDLNVTLSITHPNVEDLEVTLVAPDGVTRVPLVANLPASGANLPNTTFDDEASNNIAMLDQTTAQNPNAHVGTFRPSIVPGSRINLLSDYDGLDAKGVWRLEIRDKTAGNSGGQPQTLNSWTLSMTPSDFRILPNPNGTDPDPSNPRTYRVYFPIQKVSGSYEVNLGPNIISVDQVASSGFAQGLDTNRNAGLAALRRDDGVDQTMDSDFLETYTSTDVGDAVFGRLVIEPTQSGALRATTSRIYVADNVEITDINVNFTLTSLQPPGQPPLMRDDDYDVFLISPNGTRLELFTDVGGVGVNFVDTTLDDEANRCTTFCVPFYVQDDSAPFSDVVRPELLKATPRDCDPKNVAATYSRGLCIYERVEDPTTGKPVINPGTGLPKFGEQARGWWTLEITDDTRNNNIAALRSWSIEITGRTTGLGEFAADQLSTSFRLFTMDPGDVRSSTQWTAVGPQGVAGANTDSSRSGAIAVDPSDPSGNTVFIAGATSGVWKTTNFLTTDTRGPTWVPLTDFAQTFGIHMGSIAVFPRNNDPKQTVVYVLTGEGDGGFAGVGFLKSMDGGATWSLQDSLNNDPATPFASRDHTFSRRETGFKVIVDPTYSNGRVAYAALSGAAGGIYKTVDGGITWTNTRPGQATDVVLDLINTEILYGAFRGEGVFISSDRGASWQLMPGGINNLQMRDVGVSPASTIPINAPRNVPNGPKGRISLARPFLSGNAAVDRAYEGRLYAIVSTPDDRFDGFYMTSDFGANWTRLHLPGIASNPTGPVGQGAVVDIPSNDDTLNTEVDPFRSVGGQGNYDQAIVVDPQNPDRVYIFGAARVPAISVDVALSYDGHNVSPFDHNNNDGGNTRDPSQGSLVRTDNAGPPPPICAPEIGTAVGFFISCGEPNRTGVFAGNYTNVASLNNSGDETRWAPLFPGVHADYHDLTAIIDPLTGRSRLLIGSDGGIYSIVVDSGYDVNGRPLFNVNDPNGFGPPLASPSIGNAIGPANGSRNGNLQMTQIYGGATQPSQVAADIAALVKNGGLFYEASQDNGSSKSDPHILENGNLAWTGYGFSGDSGAGLVTAQAADLTTLGTAYIYEWPCCQGAGNEANIIRRDGVPAVAGLDAEVFPTTAPWDFVINPRDNNELMISGPSGAVYKTDDGGRQWLSIGPAAIFNNESATALAWGAEQPNANPNQNLEADDSLFVGLPDGRVFASLTEGGDAGNEWFDISAGLFGGAVQDIAADIRQFHQNVYLVTTTRVFFLPDASAAIAEVLANGPGQNINNPWLDITSNLNSITNTIFPGAWNGEGPLGPVVDRIPAFWSSIKVDDRYAVPDADGVRFPVIYVGGGGVGAGAGVYRSFDNGSSWRQFPDIEIDGAQIQGGYLPNADITEIELALGPYDVQTGLSDFTQSLDLLVAHTYGRGTFAIRTAPLIFSPIGSAIVNPPDLISADDSSPAVPPFSASPAIPYDQDNVTNHDGSIGKLLRFSGLTARGAVVRLLGDVGGVLTELGRGPSDPLTGDWTVGINDSGPAGSIVLSYGPHMIRAQGISAAGTVGPVSDALTIFVLNEPPIVTTAPDLIDVDDHGSSNTDNLTNVSTPRFTGVARSQFSNQPVPNATVRVLVRDQAGLFIDTNDPNPATNHYRQVGTGITAADGSWTAQVTTALVPDTTYIVAVRVDDLAGNVGPISPTLPVTIDTARPTVISVGPITPDPRNIAVGTVTVVLSERVAAGSFDLADLSLTLNGGPNLIGPGVTIMNVSGGSYTVGGLAGLTASDGSYMLTVSAAGMVDDAGNIGNGSGSDSWVMDSIGPSVTTVGPITPNPRRNSVQTINVIFSEAINPTTFDLGDLTLTRNGGPNLINVSVTITQLDAVTFDIGGLQPLTGMQGTYTFTVSAPGVKDFATNDGVNSGSVTWQLDLTAPFAISVGPVTPDPRNSPVTSVSVLLSESIKLTTFTFSDLTLRRNSVNINLNSAVQVTGSGPSYTVTLPASLTQQPGTYDLTVTMAGILDLAGNQGVTSGAGASATDSWVMDTTAPTIVSVGPVTPDPRNIAVSSVNVVFSERLDDTTFDFNDLTLKMNAATIALTNAVGVSFVSGTTYLIQGLNGFTGGDGNYQLMVNATTVRDQAGNAGVGTASDSWTMDATAPVITDVVDVIPDPRQTLVSTVNVVLSEPINLATFDLNDLTLTRNGGANLITPASGVIVSYLAGTTYEISGLDSLTDADGTYTLNVFGSGIQDDAGNPGSNSNSDTWVLDRPPSIVDVVDVMPDPRNAAVSSVDVIFSEPINLATFDFNDITLTRGGGPNLITSAVTVSFVSGSTYRINNLAAVTATQGTYTLTVNSTTVRDSNNNPGTNVASDSWTTDTTQPVLAVTPVAPDPRTSPVPTINVVFSELINDATFDFNDLTLTRNGGPNLISNLVSVTFLSGTTYQISGLSTLTTLDGTYLLTVNNADIFDAAGNAAAGPPGSIVSDTWMMDTIGPTVVSVGPVSSPRNDAVISVDVQMSEVVDLTTFDFSDLTLRRDGGANLITNSVTITGIGPIYMINLPASLTNTTGTYVLTASAAAVRDPAGNIGFGSAQVGWTVDRTAPTVVRVGPVTPDPRNTAVAFVDVQFSERLNDVTFDSNDITLSLNGGADTIPGSGVTTSFVSGTTYRISGLSSLPALLTQSEGTYTLTVLGTGVQDFAGNQGVGFASDTWVMDTTSPTSPQGNCSGLDIVDVTPDPTSAAVPSIDVTFCERLNDATFNFLDLKLTRDGGPNLITSAATTVTFVSGSTYRIGNLTGLTTPLGNYSFMVDGTGVQDPAGNAGTDMATELFARSGPAQISGLRLLGKNGAVTTKVISQIVMTFDHPLNAAAATDSNNFRVVSAGGDGKFGTNDDLRAELAVPQCNSPTNCTVVTLNSNRGLALNQFFQLTVDDTVTDAGGNRIDGDGNGQSGGDYVKLIALGRKFTYNDSNGDFVTLSLSKSALGEFVRHAPGADGVSSEGETLRINNPKLKRGTLTGSVAQPTGGDGVTRLMAITGLVGSNISNALPSSFVVGSISANVVDRLLDSGESPIGLLADAAGSSRRHA